MLARLAALLLWRSFTLACLALGIVGIFLPVMPTPPFLLLAAWAAGRGWPQFEAWLLVHPRLGPPIRRWRDHRAVPRGAKWLASAGMLGSAMLVAASGAPSALKLALPSIFLCVGWWLWRRPEI
jgi:uncharacterized membrane protein YbaN (DUF454 family)